MNTDVEVLEEEQVVTPEAPAAEEPSLRETLSKAFDEQESKEPVTGEPEQAAKPAEEAAPAAPADTEKPADEKSTEAAAPGVPGELKAPSQWKPAVREKWSQLPREVQEEVLRREGDSMRLIGSVGHKIRLADEVGRHIEPFSETLKANGVSPSVFLGDIFTSVKSLSSGSPQEKAEIVANMVQSYGIDVRMLDAVLTHRLQAGPEVVEARRLAARAQSTIQENQQYLAHQSAFEAEKSLAAFGADPKHEFLADVRDFMADLIETGKVENLEDAYAAAVWANPDTRKILLQRQAQERAESKVTRAAAARKASSAVHGSPASSAVAPVRANMSVREAVEAAFDEHSQL